MQAATLDQPYRAILDKAAEALEQAYSQLVSQGPLSLEGTDITQAILLRLRAYYQSQKRMTGFLGKRYMASGADFFVETVLFYLKAFFETQNGGFQVASERQLGKSRNSLRPDISVWRGDEVTAAIECKTQLGWNRLRWESDFLEREQRLHKDYPNCQVFLVVMTTSNWSGFGPENPKVGTQYFALTRVWPSEITDGNIASTLVEPIEGLLKRFKSLGTALAPGHGMMGS